VNEVQSVFQDVIRDAGRESDKEIKEIAQYQLTNIWEPEYRAHNDHIKDIVLPAIEKCKECRSGDR
jgi:hypothetical protein